MIKGRIHSVETCGTGDGPGIRFVVFMQGCLWRCLYCHNRDTWDREAGTEKTLDELMTEIKSYRHYLESSGGGVTASGGEATLQKKFVTELFKACHAEGFHTTLDTNGYVKYYDQPLLDLLEQTDLVLLDIKHMDEKNHQALTQVPNHYTLDFARYLAKQSFPMWIRMVIVPDWTDGVENMEKLAQFIIHDLNNQVEKVELLPYHTLGAHKWALLGDHYQLLGVKPPSKEVMQTLVEILTRQGVNAVIG